MTDGSQDSPTKQPNGRLPILIWINEGIKLQNAGKFKKALRCFIYALEADSNQVNIWYRIGNCWQNLGYFEDAIAAFTACYQRSLLQPNIWLQAASQLCSGKCYVSLQKQDQAIIAYRLAYQLFSQVENNLHTQQAWDYLDQAGNNLLNNQQFESAIQYYQSLLKVVKACNNLQNLALVWHGLGSGFYGENLDELAIECHRQMLDISGRLSDVEMENTALRWLTCETWRLGQIETAIDYFKQRLRVIQTLQRPQEQQEILGWIIQGYKQLNQLENTIDYYQQKLGLLREKQDISTEYSTLYDLASVYFDLKEYSLAIDRFKEALNLESSLESPYNQGNLNYMLGLIYYTLNQSLESIPHFEKAIAVYEQQEQRKEWVVRSLDYLEKLYQPTEHFEKLVAVLEKRLTIVRESRDCSNEHSLIYRLGDLYYKLQNYSQALDYFNSALALAQQLTEKQTMFEANSHYMLAQCYENLEQPNQAIKQYQNAVEFYREVNDQYWLEKSSAKLKDLKENFDSTDSAYWLKKIYKFLNSENYQEVLNCSEFLLKIEPNNWQGLYYQSSAYFNLSDYSEALNSLNKLLEFNLSDDIASWAWVLKGATLFNGFKMYKEALDAFNQALLFKDDNETAIQNRNIVLKNLGFSNTEIDESTDNELVTDFNDPLSWKNLGRSRKESGRNKESLIAYERALDLNPNDYEAWREKGIIAWELNVNDKQESLNCWNKAIELNPNDIQTYLVKGNLILSLNREDQAVNQLALNCFECAIRCDSRNCEAWLGRGKALSILGRYEESIFNYTQARAQLLFSNENDSKSLQSINLKEALGILGYGEGLAHSIYAAKQENSQEYWLKAEQSLQTSLANLTDLSSRDWRLRTLQEIVSVKRKLNQELEAKSFLYEGIDLLDQYMQEISPKHRQDQFSKEFTNLKNWHTDDKVRYRKLFMDLLDGVDEGWNKQQVLEFVGESYDNIYFIRWLNEFGKQELEKYGTPDFDRGYLMIKLGDIGCGELGIISQSLGYKIIGTTIDHAEQVIEESYQKYCEGDFKEAWDKFRWRNDFTFDYRVVKSCRKEFQEKLEKLEEGLISFYTDVVPEKNDYLAWFNLGESLKVSKYHRPAILSFRCTLRLTKCQYWEAWASLALIDLIEFSGGGEASRIADLGLKFIQRNAVYSKDASGVINEIKGDYYSEGRGVLYEIKGDSSYRYEYIKGPSLAMTPINSENGGLPYYQLWRGWWENAYDCYRKALDCFDTPRLQERRLGIFQKLVKICRCLGKKDEAQYFEQEGCDLLGRLRQEMPSNQAKIELSRKFAAFNQYRVDSLAESEQIWDALQLAESRKNLCLQWLQSDELECEVQLKRQDFERLLKPGTAILYWHISPAAITLFILKYQQNPEVCILKNETLYQYFSEPKSFLGFPAPKVTEEDFILGTSGVYDNQLVRLEHWLENWKKSYSNYRGDKTKKGNTNLKKLGLDDYWLDSHVYPWRDQMVEKLDKLTEVLQIDLIISKYLDGIKTLILVPHRDLHLVPLEYLFWTKGFSVSRIPSIQLGLNLQKEQSNTPLTPISIEHPETSMPLRFAIVESSILAHRYQIPKEHRIIGQEATHQRILQAIQIAASILHFTGHGEHDLDSPTESALILANEEKLTLKQILNLPLPEYYLVCLSACETGLTNTSNLLDEFVGLVSAFLAKKTSYVLSTLWRVDQISTTLLVTEFYKGIKEQVHPALALRNAQYWLRELTYPQLAQWYSDLATEIKPTDPGCANYIKPLAFEIRKNSAKIDLQDPPYAHPYYWAGFTITGKIN